jgi:hypothetical protein
MIPYDDLVVALTAWRARQGLPVAQLPVVQARTAPPVAPPAAAPVASPQADELIEDAAYDDAGDDYVVPLGGESTSIGAPPDGSKRW